MFPRLHRKIPAAVHRFRLVLYLVLVTLLSTAGEAQHHKMNIRSDDPDYVLSQARKAMPYDKLNALAWTRQAITLYEKKSNWLGLFEGTMDLEEFSDDEAEVVQAKEEISRMLALAAGHHKQLNKLNVDEFQPILERAFDHMYVEAAALLGKRLVEVGRKEEGFTWYLNAATKGYAPAMVQLGLMYSYGEGVEKDLEKAASWLRPANVKKSAAGKQLLADCFLHGKGVEKNFSVAVRLLHEALDIQKTGRTLDMLGNCYHKGLGTKQDSTQAATYYQQACDLAYYDSYAHLANLYLQGDGVTTNEATGIRLLRDGIDKGNNPNCMYAYGLALWKGTGVKQSRWRAKRHIARAAGRGQEQAQTWCIEHKVRY